MASTTRMNALQRQRRRNRTDAEIEDARNRLHPAGTKHCSWCERDRPLGDFGADRARSDALRQQCRPCRAAKFDDLRELREREAGK